MDPIKRLQYHDGQLLDVSDFTEEQDYHREMRKRHNRSVHTWGIVEGLDVEPAEKKITISPGMAIDKDGQELILLRKETHPADLKSAPRYVTARFEYPDDDTPSMVKKDTDGKKMYSRRTIERAKIEVVDKEPTTDGSVMVLAKLTVDGEGKITVDQSARSRSVHRAADLTVARLSLQWRNDKRGALFLGGLGDFNHALYNNISNIDGEVAWDGTKWNVYLGLNIRCENKQSALFIDRSRNVGIGTTDPKSTLSVKGGLAVGASYAGTIAAPDNGLLVEGNVGIGTTAPRARLEVAVTAADANTKPLMVGKGTTNYLTMLNDGNVGIGATAPTATLQIGETITHHANKPAFLSAPTLLVRAKDNNFDETLKKLKPMQSVLALVREGVGGQAYGNMVDFRLGRWEHVGKPNFNSRSQLDIYLTEDTFEPKLVMSLRANGNVGIGTTSPGAKLEVGGTLTASTDEALVALKIAPTFQDSGKTGVKHYGLIVADGNVGIGTTSPGAKLEVVGQTKLSGLVGINRDPHAKQHLIIQPAQGNMPLNVVDPGNTINWLSVFESGNVIMNGGNVGIGTTTPGPFKLYVKGDVRVEGKVWAEKLVHHWEKKWFTFDDKTTGVYHLDIANEYPSDTRFKTDLRPICNALEKLMQLHGVCYRWGETGLKFLTRDIPNRQSAGPGATEEENHKLWETERRKAYEALSGQNIGLVAQDVETVVPEVVHEDEAGYKYIRYQQLVALVVEAVKEQNALIQALSAKVAG